MQDEEGTAGASARIFAVDGRLAAGKFMGTAGIYLFGKNKEKV